MTWSKGKHIAGSMPDLIEKSGKDISVALVHWRMKHFGWDIHKAINTPKMTAGRKKRKEK